MPGTDLEVIEAIATSLRSFFAAVTDLPIHVEALGFLSGEMPSVDFVPAAASGLITPASGFGQIRGPLDVHLRTRVSPADTDAGQELLWALCDDVGDLSILVALDSMDPHFGGLVDTIAWGDWGEWLEFIHPQGEGVLLGRTLPLSIVKTFS